MRLIEWLKTKFNPIVFWFRRQDPAIPKPPPLPKPLPETVKTFIEHEVKKVLIGTKTAELRKLERLRRRHDKFVTPKGPTPAKIEREPAPPRPKPQPVSEPEPEPLLLASGNLLIADKHHEDREGEKVLYEETEIYGVFNFRDTILQQLERYFVYLERMKKHDSDAYHLYRQIGAVVVPYLANGAHFRNLPEAEKQEKDKDRKELSPWFRQTRPSFGCFVFGADPETEKFEQSKTADDGMIWWVPKFMYYTKYSKPPPEFERISGGDVYKMTIWWDQPFNKKFTKKHKSGTPQEYGVFISADGKAITILRVIETKYVKVYSRRKHEEFRVPQRLWHIPKCFNEWAKESNMDVQTFLGNLFVRCSESLELAQTSMVRVAATKNNMVAIFGVNIDRMAYFFQDRDIHLNEDGHRKRIFHMVRQHKRKDGTIVPFHFRGERQFTWADYDIAITVPGRDHFILDEFNVGALDEYWSKKKDKTIRMKELGSSLVKDMKSGLGGLR